MIRSRKLPKDQTQLAAEIVRLTTQDPDEPKPEETGPLPERSPISEYLAQIGRKGGLKGGRARAKKLTAKKRKEIAQRAARARWKTHPHGG